MKAVSNHRIKKREKVATLPAKENVKVNTKKQRVLEMLLLYRGRLTVVTVIVVTHC